MSTPLGALVRGIAAGVVASAAMGAFFKTTSGVAPSPPRFRAPDARRREEPTEILARRFVGGLMKRGPLPKRQRQLAANLVHYGYGVGWAAAWAILRETFPRALARPAPALGFGAAMWALSDELLLPAFRLAPWPNRVPARVQAYFLGAHAVYAASLWVAYEWMRRQRAGAAVPV